MVKDSTGKEYKVVIVTPAGREKYLDIIKKYVYRDMTKGLIDGWQLWQNTVKQSDIDYHASMAAENPKVQVFTIPNLENKYNFCDTWRTCEFFKNAQDDDTIYIRLDDDIVWYEENAIEKIAMARIEHPDAFAIYPVVMDSTIITAWHQASGALGLEAGAVKQPKADDPNWAYLDEFNYSDSGLIDLMHETFKKKYEEGKLADYYLPSRSLEDYQRFSICSLCWWGKDHVLPGPSEESQLAWELPAAANRPVYLLGDALLVHYSYHTQRDYLESCSPEKLEFYKNLSDQIK